MTSSKTTLQDKALADLKLSFQIIEELNKQENKHKLPIFENSLRFTFQEIARTLRALHEIEPDTALLEKIAFLNPLPDSLNILDLQPQLLALQKYLLATLL